ncbi:TRL-like family protein [Candidatus Hydrogenedentota bacterium]
MRLCGCLLLVSTIFMSGCVSFSSPVVPGFGGVSLYKAPLDINFDETDLGEKTGESSVHTILWVVSFGDCGANAAAKDGGIEVIKHADYEHFNVLGMYSRYTTIVYGD